MFVPNPVVWKEGAAVPVGLAPNEDCPNPVDVLAPNPPKMHVEANHKDSQLFFRGYISTDTF